MQTTTPISVAYNLSKILFRICEYLGILDEYYSLSEKYMKKTLDFDIGHYNSNINPYKILWVEPKQITKVTKRPFPPYAPNRTSWFGKVENGNWDTRDTTPLRSGYEFDYYKKRLKFQHGTESFEDTPIFESFRNHFKCGIPWEETEYYQFYCDYYNSSKAKNKLVMYDEIYQKIISEGYKTQNNINPDFFPRVRSHEIMIDIGRNGEFLFAGGRHRLAIAKILHLERIPVIVLVRHKLWAQRIQTLSEFNSKEDCLNFKNCNEQLLNHPDLENIFD